MRWLVLLVAASVLAGCMTSASPRPEEVGGVGGHAVVAVIDTGIDPYHGVFHRVVERDVGELGLGTGDVKTVVLSGAGSHAARRSTDAPLWEGLEPGVLYRFAGTNILAISFGTGEPVWDERGHGTAVAGALVTTDPGVWVVVVEGMGAEAEAWVAAQGWIDIVSMSYGAGGAQGAGAMPEGTRAMWEAGQVPVVAAGNEAGWAPDDAGAGPPWVVGVSGDDPERGCTEPGTPHGADVSADFSARLPQAGTLEGWSARSGTSFAAPVVSGVLSATLRGVRASWDAPVAVGSQAFAMSDAGGTLWPQQLRDSLFAVGVPFASDCDGDARSASERHGHGHVGPASVDAAVRVAFSAAEAPPAALVPVTAGAAASLDAVRAYREERWQ